MDVKEQAGGEYAYQVVAYLDILYPAAAALVRRVDIDGFHNDEPHMQENALFQNEGTDEVRGARAGITWVVECRSAYMALLREPYSGAKGKNATSGHLGPHFISEHNKRHMDFNSMCRLLFSSIHDSYPISVFVTALLEAIKGGLL